MWSHPLWCANRYYDWDTSNSIGLYSLNHRRSRTNTSCATWWRQQMETISASLALCVGNSPVAGEFPSQRPVTRSFDGFFYLRLNKRLNYYSAGYWRRHHAPHDGSVINIWDAGYGFSFSTALKYDIDGLVQEIRNSSALTMELRLPCTNPSTYTSTTMQPNWLWNYQSILRIRHLIQRLWNWLSFWNDVALVILCRFKGFR